LQDVSVDRLYPGCCLLPVIDVLLYSFMLAVASFDFGVKAGMLSDFLQGCLGCPLLLVSVLPFDFLQLLSPVGLRRCLLLGLVVVRGRGDTGSVEEPSHSKPLSLLLVLCFCQACPAR
jgi:hypothetical protein